MFGNITPNCRSASVCSLKVSLASELLLTRSWHHRGSGVTPPSHLSNEYFDKFVRGRERHINLSDHNVKIKHSNLESRGANKDMSPQPVRSFHLSVSSSHTFWSSSSSSSLGHGRPSAGNGLAGSSGGDQFGRKKLLIFHY